MSSAGLILPGLLDQVADHFVRHLDHATFDGVRHRLHKQQIAQPVEHVGGRSARFVTGLDDAIHHIEQGRGIGGRDSGHHLVEYPGVGGPDGLHGVSA